MLKEGTIPIVDQPLIQAVKYALDQMGVNPDFMPRKKRRTCLDGVGTGDGDSGYLNYFAVSAVETTPDGVISRVHIYDGADPDSGSAGMTDLYDVMSAELDVQPGHRYICLNLVYDSTKREYMQTFSAEYVVPSENTPSVILAEITDSGKRLIQRWTAGRVYWRHRFIIPSLRGMF